MLPGPDQNRAAARPKVTEPSGSFGPGCIDLHSSYVVRVNREDHLILGELEGMPVELARENGHRRVEVRVVSVASLNGRQPAPLIDPDVDLAAEPYRWFAPTPWVLPLEVEHGEAWVKKGRSNVAKRPQRGSR